MKATKIQLMQVGRALNENLGKELGVTVKVKDIEMLLTTRVTLELSNEDAKKLIAKYSNVE